MQRKLTGYAIRADDDKPIVWLASSPERARDKLEIPVDAWDTTDFLKQGSPLMWGHQYNEPPIGRVTSLTTTPAGLVAETVFSKATERARDVEALVREGTINCCSVGFDIIEQKGQVVTKASLVELSVVSIGADTNAVVLARSAFDQGIPFHGETTAFIPTVFDKLSHAASLNQPVPDFSSPARATWDETAASMVRLICTAAQRPETERTTEYRALAREYARHGKTPPELLEAETVTALGSTELRGLFLEGEPDLFPNTFALAETRAGAVLSKRNLDDLQRATELILGVMARAVKEAEAGESDPEPVDDARALLLAFHNVTKTKELNHA